MHIMKVKATLNSGESKRQHYNIIKNDRRFQVKLLIVDNFTTISF